MLAFQVVELSKGAYQILEEIGYGASSKVYLVQPFQRNLIQLHTQTTNAIPPDHHPQEPLEELNPDLARLDELIVEARSNSPVDPLVINEAPSSNLMENGRQISPMPGKYGEEVGNGKEMFALKTVIIESDSAEQRRKQKEFWKEVEMLEKLRHPGIVRAIDHGVTTREGKRELHLLTEWGRGGNFLRFLDAVTQASFTPIDAEIIYKYCIAQIVEIVDYLQSMGVSHRDLKAENFILDEKHNLKLIDFGLSQEFSRAGEGEGEEDKGYVGTKQYISPEMIDRGRHSCPRDYYSKADVWSIGVLIYYIFTRRYPFSGINTYSILQTIKNKEPDFHQFHNPQLRQLLASMLRKNPADRAIIREVKMSPYFSDVDFQLVFTRESPFPKLLREQGEETIFTSQLVVRIFDQAKRRVISLTRRPNTQNRVRKDSILHHFSSLADIDIKKNPSGNTEGFSTENRIESSASLDIPQTQKYFFTIGKVGSRAHPKYLQIFESTNLTAQRGTCRLDWTSRRNSFYEDEPQSVELKFESQETFEAFISSFQRIKDSMI